jgi:hypothetical protein
LSEWYHLVCRLMIIILPISLMAQDANRGLLHSDGGTWLNEVQAPAIAAIFPDSLVQTQADHVATIDVAGSNVLIQPETMVQFQGHELALDHGGLQLDTSTEMEVIVGCITITPIRSDRTQYDVINANGRVRVDATKSDVKIHLHSGVVRKSKQGASSDIIVHQGEHATRSERCGAMEQTPKSASGLPLDSLPAVMLGLAVVGTLICLGVCHGDDAISPAKP